MEKDDAWRKAAFSEIVLVSPRHDRSRKVAQLGAGANAFQGACRLTVLLASDRAPTGAGSCLDGGKRQLPRARRARARATGAG